MRDTRKPDYEKLGKANGSRGGLRSTSYIKFIAIHHSGVEADNSTEEIDSYHRTVLGWPGVGYHFIIRKNGDIEYCGDLATMRYNVAGLNLPIVGICLVGNFNNHHPTPEQLGAAKNLVTVLMPVLDPEEAGDVLVLGHNELALEQYPTVCPGYTWPEWNHIFSQWR
jgi:N-acetylmuramoyl-L-alanine amidase